MKKLTLLFIIAFSNLTNAHACGPDPDYAKNLVAKTDTNNDGKISFEEYQALEKHKPVYIVKRTWENQGGKKGYLTPKELVGDTVESIKADCERSKRDDI